MPPSLPLLCPASSAKQILRLGARDSSLVTWLFLLFQPESQGGVYNRVMKTGKAEEHADPPASCVRGEAVMSSDQSKEITCISIFSLILHLPPLLFSPLLHRKEKREKAMRGENGVGCGGG